MTVSECAGLGTADCLDREATGVTVALELLVGVSEVVGVEGDDGCWMASRAAMA